MTGNSSAPAAQPSPPRLSYGRLFLKFLRFGALAFGGPVAQIGMLRHVLVDEERWIGSARFNRLLAVLQVLPGPEAHELCVHLGMVARGRIGGLLAGLGFMLPGFVLMLVAAWAYTTWVAANAGWAGAWLGAQIVVLAIILRAAVRIGEHIIEDWLLGTIAGASLLATAVGVPFWLPLVAGGVAYSLSNRPIIACGAVLLALLSALGLHFIAGPAPSAPPVLGAPVTLWALFGAGLKGGLLTFGGAYTAIPYVRADTVERGWLSDATFLDGVALAGLLPAPLVIFATFVGYVAGGLSGALAVTLGMFLPAFAFSLILFERLEAAVENPALHRILMGVAAAVVGVIAATLVQLGEATAARVDNPAIGLALFAAAMAAAWRLRGAWVTPAIVVGGAVLGWAIMQG